MNIENFKKNKGKSDYLYLDLLVTYSISEVKNAIINSLSDDLLKPDYLKNLEMRKSNVYGHCYAASEAMYYLTGGKSKWTPQQGRCEVLGSHWWLKEKSTNEIMDLTADQFFSLDLAPPYGKGKGRGFQNQSFRTLEIMKRVILEFGLSEDILMIGTKEKAL